MAESGARQPAELRSGCAEAPPCVLGRSPGKPAHSVLSCRRAQTRSWQVKCSSPKFFWQVRLVVRPTIMFHCETVSINGPCNG